MPTSADGILTATFDPVRNLVALQTDGPSWADPVTEVTLTRTAPGAAAIPVRGAEHALAPGGTLIWSDNEAPMDAEVTYMAEGYDSLGLLETTSVTVTTEGAVWGLWVKIPGRPEMTVRVPLASVGDLSRQTLGGAWQVPGGPTLSQSGSGALSQSGGMGALSTQIVVLPQDMAALIACERAVQQAPGQAVLLQAGTPDDDLPSGYYWVQAMRRTNPGPVRSDHYGRRHLVLDIVETVIPAGPATGWNGVTYQDILDQFATYQDIVDANITYLDLATGSW